MKTLGLLGGMTYGATAIYYTLINETIQRKLGGTNSAQILLQSFNHAETGALFNAGKWPQVIEKFVAAGNNLKSAGADALMICCNIGHKVAVDLEQQVGLPVLHIADFTGEIIRAQGMSKVALIGTKPVMEQEFFRDRLGQKYGIEVVVPSEQKRVAIHDVIMHEMGANVFNARQKELLLAAIEETKEQGAKGVIFACTELQFVVKQEDVDVPVWDTMQAHALGAAEWAVRDDV